MFWILFLLLTSTLEARFQLPFEPLSIVIMEGGSFSIDIRQDPLPTKLEAMRNYLESRSFQNGVYFGDQNQSPDDRDGAIAQIEGLTVYGVDKKQDTIIPTVMPIGIGMEATSKKLKDLLSNPPAFIGFDVDDTVLGLRGDKSKEELLKERIDIAQSLVQFLLKGTQVVFFTDNDSQVTLKRIAYPLAELMQKYPFEAPLSITFYSSGMVTKMEMTIFPKGTEIELDQEWGQDWRVNGKTARLLQGILGGVQEIDGVMVGEGLLGEYYFNKLTFLKSGQSIRNPDFYPDFLTKLTPQGNTIPPQLEWRDFDGATCSMVSITGIPSLYRPVLIEAIMSLLIEFNEPLF